MFNRPLAAAGALFVIYPLVRPWGDATPDGMAAAFGSPFWLVAHMAAMAAFVLVGVAGLPSRAAQAAWVAGTALVLPYYGAEAFALHALAGTPDVAALAEQIRMGATQVTVFGLGLGLLAVAGVLFADPALRIAHGVLLAIGCLVLATRVDEKALAPAG